MQNSRLAAAVNGSGQTPSDVKFNISKTKRPLAECPSAQKNDFRLQWSQNKHSVRFYEFQMGLSAGLFLFLVDFASLFKLQQQSSRARVSLWESDVCGITV